jgi:hypothetical protein
MEPIKKKLEISFWDEIVKKKITFIILWFQSRKN